MDDDYDHERVHRLARFGTDVPGPSTRRVAVGPLTFAMSDGAVRAIAWRGTEVVRGIDYMVRDASWATLATYTVREALSSGEDGFAYLREFSAGEAFDGTFVFEARVGDGAQSTARLTLTARRDVVANRAGLVVLHPVDGVAGEPLTVEQPDGARHTVLLSQQISPRQPARNIAALEHEVNGVSVAMGFTGDVFEMEDQRNWSDASFKTYSRPLDAPRPFVVRAGDVVEQTVVLRVSGHPLTEPARTRQLRTGSMPAIVLAHEEAIAPLDAATEAAIAPALSAISFDGVLLRTKPESVHDDLKRSAVLGEKVDLEVVIPNEEPLDGAMNTVACACADHSIPLRRITALPEAYLESIQPDGPWPSPTPADAVAATRLAFDRVSIGGGALTNFAELNRCRADYESDFVTFGSTALVHAASDRSVRETLDTLPQIFASAREIATVRPLCLGLFSIGMRSNPYGRGVVANPDLERQVMAMDDPRQRGLFGAAFAVGCLAAAAEAWVSSLALSMALGPLGIVRHNGDVHPLYHVVRAAAQLAGREVTVHRHSELTLLMAGQSAGHKGGEDRLIGLAANLGDTPATLDEDAPVAVMDVEAVAEAATSADWLSTAARERGAVVLMPLDVAFVFESQDGETEVRSH